MINLAHCCVLHWTGDHPRTVPFNKSSSTPIFYSAPSVHAYKSFISTFKAMQASLFQKETNLLRPPGHLTEHVAPEEFVADEYLHCGALTTLVEKRVHEDNKAVQSSTLPLAPDSDKDTPSHEAIHHVPLTFDS